MLWTPPSAQLREKTSEYTASVHSMVQKLKGKMDEFNRELYRMDPTLELIFVPPNAELLGAIPGRYHVLRTIPDGPPTLIPITGPSGEFVEPDSGLFTWLAEHDMQNPRARHERERIRRRAEEAQARAKAREDEERQEELVDRFNAAFRTSVSMTDAGEWRQTAKARRSK